MTLRDPEWRHPHRALSLR